MDNNTPIPVTLEAQQWNVVVGQLMEGPYKTMAPLIGLIISQCNPQPAPPPSPPGSDMQQGPRLVVADGPPPGIASNGSGQAGEGDAVSNPVPAAE
jgi:hypothetical protein